MTRFHQFLNSIDLWVWHGIYPGSFLHAVLCNNLSQAIGHADEESRNELFEIVRFLHNACPSICWGSEERVNRWRVMNHDDRIALVDSSSYPRSNPAGKTP